ncbi:AcrR family transcriptional regulator [Sporomusaceae bacterium BoRhaA]|uniref:TetR/AcrR family transcriptional regulator n=1 Tax=Pelorhabdus rhamnosifermentans TaxID=2772457 RepID=UPI001C061DC7|nr:TetR/AcrR family transcriptional regulator [Pelorhabdus rhamnosifermentans]MBU2700188.1 AcrR family transcriptional regulator [Pelorhabdus rhamnosifermentans]
MDDLKDLILDKAKERFDRFGYKKTTMDEISRDCKISKKTIYGHFNDKEDLFISLMLRESSKNREMIFARIEEFSDPLDKLTQLIKISLAYFNEDNFLTRLLKADETLFSTFLSKKYHSMIGKDIILIIADIIIEGKKQGEFRDVDEQLAAYAGVRLFQAFSYMRTIEFSQEKMDQGYYTDMLVDFIVHAIVKR